MSVTTAAIAVAAVLALIAIVAMVSRKPRRTEWDAAPAALGMEPMSALDPALTAAIISLHRPPVPDTFYEQKRTWSLTRIYRYPVPGVNCYSITVHLEQTGEIWMHGATMRTETRETRGSWQSLTVRTDLWPGHRRREDRGRPRAARPGPEVRQERRQYREEADVTIP